MIKLIYDPNRSISYGRWDCPICGNGFYGNGSATHKEGCSLNSYDGCDYIFGPKEVELAKKAFEYSNNENIPGPLGPVSIKLLKEQGFGELLRSDG